MGKVSTWGAALEVLGPSLFHLGLGITLLIKLLS